MKSINELPDQGRLILVYDFTRKLSYLAKVNKRMESFSLYPNGELRKILGQEKWEYVGK